jgi:hypothetical protein
MGQTSVTWVLSHLRTSLALPAVEKWHLCQMDVKKTIYNGRLTEELYMKQPIGLEDGTGRVCRLVKSIYPNRQKAYGTMLNFRYTRLQSVHCACILRGEERIIVVWVDDMVSVANTKETNDKFVEKLAAKYKIKVIGELYMLLGMHITPDH